MLLIHKNKIGEIFISRDVINNIIKNNFNKVKHNVKILSIHSVIHNNELFLEIKVLINNKKNIKFNEINDYIYSLINKITKNNLNLMPKNISIIHN